ncbi:MAG: ATP-dependent zinc protease [Gammaproteobacteria bacterium]
MQRKTPNGRPTNGANHRQLIQVGWREWLSLPELGVEHIKVKVDTGARTSALHAFAIKPFKKEDKHWLYFDLHPLQSRKDIVIKCEAEVKDIRWVSDSGGHRERRYVIVTPMIIDGQSWPIEITLTNRDNMRFRMLLGRTAIHNRLLVNPASSYLAGKYKGKL